MISGQPINVMPNVTKGSNFDGQLTVILCTLTVEQRTFAANMHQGQESAKYGRSRLAAFRRAIWQNELPQCVKADVLKDNKRLFYVEVFINRADCYSMIAAVY